MLPAVPEPGWSFLEGQGCEAKSAPKCALTSVEATGVIGAFGCPLKFAPTRREANAICSAGEVSTSIRPLIRRSVFEESLKCKK